MKKILILFCLLPFFLIAAVPRFAFAALNPLSVPNNKFGVHILFPSELQDAARLVNSSGGDWGYVVIPIKASDKNLGKWQNFMNEASGLHIIPVLRLATDGDYFNTKVWEKPTYATVLDFANFLDSLVWPTQNRYVIIFNEPNRGDEWGGSPNPSEYAKILSYAVSVFKSRNQNFFILSAGLDNAAQNITDKSMNEYTFLKEMNAYVPGIFNQIDGFASHSYPNPGFEQPPSAINSESIASFRYEENLVSSLTNKKLPVFITETGWSLSSVPDRTVASFYTQAFNTVWSDANIVMVSPFLLSAGKGPFAQFSLLRSNGFKTDEYKSIEEIRKTKGEPLLGNNSILSDHTFGKRYLPTMDFSNKATGFYDNFQNSIDKIKAAETFFKWMLKL